MFRISRHNVANAVTRIHFWSLGRSGSSRRRRSSTRRWGTSSSTTSPYIRRSCCPIFASMSDPSLVTGVDFDPGTPIGVFCGDGLRVCIVVTRPRSGCCVRVRGSPFRVETCATSDGSAQMELYLMERIVIGNTAALGRIEHAQISACRPACPVSAPLRPCLDREPGIRGFLCVGHPRGAGKGAGLDRYDNAS
jgi:hypothetical protein